MELRLTWSNQGAAANPAIASRLQSWRPAGRVAELGSLGGITRMGWRRHTFAEGRRYRVVTDCDVQLERVYRFRAGEVVVFCRDNYSHYDGLSVYSFRTSSGEESFWALHDSEPDDKWQTYFERVDETIAA